MSVVGAGGHTIDLAPGEPWPLPYKGSRYTVRQVERRLHVIWWWQDMYAKAAHFAAETVKSLRLVNKPRGSFCVTSHGALVTKVPVGNGHWRPTFAGKFVGDIAFGQIDTNPKGLEMGVYWTGFPFHHGETWYVSARERADDLLMWKHQGLRLGSTSRFPQLYKRYLDIRPRGGRLYITEHGHVWMNLPDDEVSDAYVKAFAGLQKAQVDQLISSGKGAILRLLKSRLAATGCRPVYLGHISEFDGGQAPWTFFTKEATKSFGLGSEGQFDDVESSGDW